MISEIAEHVGAVGNVVKEHVPGFAMMEECCVCYGGGGFILFLCFLFY